MEDALLKGSEPLLETVVVGIIGFAGIVFLLRISGKRTLSKMNMFDFLVTVAFGSTLAAMLTSKGTTLVQGLVAFAVLILLQYVVTALSVRSQRFQSFIKAHPTLLFHDGVFCRGPMKKERVTEPELFAAMRGAGFASIEDVAAMILETDGSISVIGRSQAGKIDLIPGVTGDPDERAANG